MRIIFMGTPDFAVPSLRALAERHEVLAVVTQPDKPAGRGKKLCYSEVKQEALTRGFEVLQPKKARSKEFVEKMTLYAPDVIVVAAYGQFLPESILKLPKHGCINVHGSLLPKYRGASPVQAAILAGDSFAGPTIMKMEKGIDTGDIILQQSFIIEESDTAGSVFDKMAESGALLLLESISLIEAGVETYTKQDEALVSYAPKITKEMGHIDFTQPANKINNLVRAMNPWPGAYVYINNEIVKVWSVEVCEHISEQKPGSVLTKREPIVVKCADACIRICELQAQNGKRMNTKDFVNGYKHKTIEEIF